ncbi:hypothetical protein AaE_015113 [Aphanomyces astaci]|uniref:Tc1-like transposase DDE domain-containing protein n=1 Tax=Aphanomyces astaci TaxID=112090 RepID=A0A6A4Z9R5_APHAT|nr:hypothetical protein AaE_015113 [Aphanomyces astaci]
MSLKIEKRVRRSRVSDASFLKLGPYSPMLNSIENMWSALKSRIKTCLRERVAAFMGPPPDGQTRNEFRMQYLEHTADEAIAGIEPNRLHVYTARLEPFYVRAENMEDMDVGA